MHLKTMLLLPLISLTLFPAPTLAEPPAAKIIESADTLFAEYRDLSYAISMSSMIKDTYGIDEAVAVWACNGRLGSDDELPTVTQVLDTQYNGDEGVCVEYRMPNGDLFRVNVAGIPFNELNAIAQQPSYREYECVSTSPDKPSYYALNLLCAISGDDPSDLKALLTENMQPLATGGYSAYADVKAALTMFMCRHTTNRYIYTITPLDDGNYRHLIALSGIDVE